MPAIADLAIPDSIQIQMKTASTVEEKFQTVTDVSFHQEL